MSSNTDNASNSITASPLSVSKDIDAMISYRYGICKGCKWHPNVCDYCKNGIHPDNLDY